MHAPKPGPMTVGGIRNSRVPIGGGGGDDDDDDDGDDGDDDDDDADISIGKT